MGTGAFVGSPMFVCERSGEAPLQIMRRVQAVLRERSAKMIYKQPCSGV